MSVFWNECLINAKLMGEKGPCVQISQTERLHRINEWLKILGGHWRCSITADGTCSYSRYYIYLADLHVNSVVWQVRIARSSKLKAWGHELQLHLLDMNSYLCSMEFHQKALAKFRFTKGDLLADSSSKECIHISEYELSSKLKTSCCQSILLYS